MHSVVSTTVVIRFELDTFTLRYNAICWKYVLDNNLANHYPNGITDWQH